jgi:ATP/maltotriose-dependent transcriptional regulator MalT
MHRTSLASSASVGAAAPRNHRVSPPWNSNAAYLSPASLLLRAWRSLIELRLDDALVTIEQFERATREVRALIPPRLGQFAELLTSVLQVFKSQDLSTVRAALVVIERRFPSAALSPALATTLRVGYWKLRDLDRYYAVPRFKHPVALNRCIHWVASIIGPMFEAAVEAQQLRLVVATRLARSAHERAMSRFGKRAPVTARAAVMLAELLYEEGCRDGVDAQIIMDSVSTLRRSGDEDFTLRAYKVMARIAARRGDTDFAFLLLNEAIVFALARDWTGMLAQVLLMRALLLLKEGRIRDSATCADRIEVLSRDHAQGARESVHGSLAMARAQIMAATGNARGAAKLLRELQELSSVRRNSYEALQLSVLRSDALLACGDEVEGRALLIQALHVGLRAGLYQTFVDAGARVTELLITLHHDDSYERRLPAELAPYVDSILAERVRPHRGASPPRASRGTESLSPREHCILRSMSCGFSNKRIALELQIAPETVKSHVKGIFVKLAVQTRAHAVSTAGALGLL